MDLRGFPNISVNNNLKFALNDMYSSEMLSRNYVLKTKSQTLYSMNPVLDKFIENIKDHNIYELEQLLNEHGDVCDEEGLNPLKIAILCHNVDALRIILNKQKYIINDVSILAFTCENFDNGMTHLIVEELLKCENIDVNKKGGSLNEIPLYYTINKNSTGIIKLLLNHKHINLGLSLINGKSLLQHTLLNRQYSIASLLLQHDNVKLDKDDVELIFGEGTVEIISTLLNTMKFTEFDTNLNEYFIKLIKRVDIPVEILSPIISHIDINYCDAYGKTSLMYSAESGNIKKLNYVLENFKNDLTITDNYGMNALMYAVTNRSYACAKILADYIKEKCDADTGKLIINQHNEIKETSILMAAKTENVMLFKLVNNMDNVNVNCVDIHGYSPLHYSIETYNLEIFDILTNNKTTNINIQDLEGNTPLMFSIKKGNDLLTYKLLVCNGLNLNKTNNYGQNIIGHILKHKYSHDSKKDDIQQIVGFGGLHEYAPYPDTLSTETLMMNMVNTRTKDFLGAFAPLETSTTKLNKLINYLIQKGVDLNGFDNDDKSLLTYAIDNKDKDVFNFLLNSDNLDINSRNNQGQTYLMYLFEHFNGTTSSSSTSYASESSDHMGDWLDASSNIRSGSIRSLSKPMKNSMNISSNDKNVYLTFFMQLLNHPKIDINATDYFDNTLLSLLALTSSVNLISKIIKHKNINVNVQNYQGNTPFMTAVSKSSWNIAKVLLEHGADPKIKDDNGKSAKDYLNKQNLFVYNKLLVSLNKNVEYEIITEKQVIQPIILEEINLEQVNLEHEKHLDQQKKSWFF